MELMHALAIAKPDIIDHAADDHPLEAVGLVFSDGSTRRLINQARSPRRFSIARAQLEEVIAESGLSPICLYPSHPAGRAVPSTPDQRVMSSQATRAGLPVPFVILGVDGLRVWLWQDGAAREIQVPHV